MILETFCSGPLRTNAYIVACSNTHKAALFDAPYQCFDEVVAFLNKKKLLLQTLFLTHSHIDHIADVSVFKKNYPLIDIVIHPLDQKNLIDPGSDGIGLFSVEAQKPTKLITDGEEFFIGDLSLEVIHTPGHSPGGVCYFFPHEKILISGDTLFKGTYGSLSLPTAQPEKMKESLLRLAKLPQTTKVYPGHGRPTTIEGEPWLMKPLS